MLAHLKISIISPSKWKSWSVHPQKWHQYQFTLEMKKDQFSKIMLASKMLSDPFLTPFLFLSPFVHDNENCIHCSQTSKSLTCRFSCDLVKGQRNTLRFSLLLHVKSTKFNVEFIIVHHGSFPLILILFIKVHVN